MDYNLILEEDDVFVVEDGNIKEKTFSKQEIEHLLQSKSARVTLEQLKGSFSEVWQYMGVVLVDGKETGFAACRTCSAKVFKFVKGSGVSHLRNHVAKFCGSTKIGTVAPNNNNRYGIF